MKLRKKGKRQKQGSRIVKGKQSFDQMNLLLNSFDFAREIAELESVKVEDDRHTAQLNKLVEGLESTLQSVK